MREAFTEGGYKLNSEKKYLAYREEHSGKGKHELKCGGRQVSLKHQMIGSPG